MYVLADDIDPRTNGIAETTLNLVDDEVRRIIDECHVRAVDQLRDHRGQLEAIATSLLEHETLDEAQVYAAAGIERPVADPEQRIRPKSEAKPATPDAPKPVPDAPWAPPDPTQQIG
jgi:cell division protease FtsH